MCGSCDRRVSSSAERCVLEDVGDEEGSEEDGTEEKKAVVRSRKIEIRTTKTAGVVCRRRFDSEENELREEEEGAAAVSWLV